MFVFDFLSLVFTFVFELLMSIGYGLVWLLLGWQFALRGEEFAGCSICLW